MLVLLALLAAPGAEARTVAARANAICVALAATGERAAPRLDSAAKYLRFAGRLSRRRATALAELPASRALRRLVRADRAVGRRLAAMADGAGGAGLLAAMAAGDRAAKRLGAPACRAPDTAPASPDPERTGVEITEYFNPDGTPRLIANTVPYGGGTVDWRICPPGADCYAVQPSSKVVHNPGPLPAGAVVEARYGPYVDRTPPWRGQVAAGTPPQLLGTPKVGETVTPAAGSWTGGWGGETDDMRVQACPTTTPVNCKTLYAPGRHAGGADGVVSAKYADWYLFAVDRRLWANAVSTLELYRSVEDVPVFAPNATTSFSAPLGPVAP